MHDDLVGIVVGQGEGQLNELPASDGPVPLIAAAFRHQLPGEGLRSRCRRRIDFPPVLAQEMKVDGGLAPLEPKSGLERKPLLVPPGAGSVHNFYDSCTACQLCVSACPNKVLRPSTGLEHLLQPMMGYEIGGLSCRRNQPRGP